MYLVKDYIYDFKGLWEEAGKCRIRVYKDSSSPTVIICSELINNQGGSITTIVEDLAHAIWRLEGEPVQFFWIEHYPASLSRTNEDTFHHVTFAQVPGGRFFSPLWDVSTREDVERLLGISV
jgi:hypothetical protein